ncbi:hypothetical protein EGH21_22615 [Halomicroarcula sp. F13]|uniref:Uncharacterized protein n=1 Tax=Haloarcula rubra TaxID=2487747 RepID=A0AAW4PZC5_9EURY|nr:hypothetical protein [Halomicroarcula rubra]MBX0325815.1 hypothetical protein [Halomicroarcula rubra]
MGFGGDEDNDPAADSTSGRLNQFDEYIFRELQIIWEHTFQKVDENAGDGITDKFFDYSGVTRSGPDVQVGEGGFIRTKEAGDYGAGQPVLAGAAGHFDSAPTGDQDGWVGYTSGDNGTGFGWDATSPYVFNDRAGGRTTVRQSDWNLHKLNGDEGEGPTLDPTDGFTLRIPHACYGHAKAVIVIGVKSDNGGFDLYPVHQFNERGQTMWEQFDVPIEWHFDGTEGDGNFLAATACHYEGEQGRQVKRETGEGWTPQKNSGTKITLNAYPAWTFIIGLKKRAGWENTDVTPSAISLNATHDVEVQLTVRGTFSGTSFGLPEDTSTTEAAAEYDVKTYDLANDSEKSTETTIDSRGEREWYDVVPGDKQSPIQVGSELKNVELASDEVFAMLVRPATSNATDVNYAAMRNGGGF